MMIPLAATVVQYFGAFKISKIYSDYSKELSNPSNPVISEMHAISAVLKPIISFFSLDAITKAREMLGGHGYSSYSSLGNRYHDQDPACTGEGDNTILLQQTTKVLLKLIPKGKAGKILDLTFLSPSLPQPSLKKEDVLNI